MWLLHTWNKIKSIFIWGFCSNWYRSQNIFGMDSMGKTPALVQHICQGKSKSCVSKCKSISAGQCFRSVNVSLRQHLSLSQLCTQTALWAPEAEANERISMWKKWILNCALKYCMEESGDTGLPLQQDPHRRRNARGESTQGEVGESVLQAESVCGDNASSSITAQPSGGPCGATKTYCTRVYTHDYYIKRISPNKSNSNEANWKQTPDWSTSLTVLHSTELFFLQPDSRDMLPLGNPCWEHHRHYRSTYHLWRGNHLAL